MVELTYGSSVVSSLSSSKIAAAAEESASVSTEPMFAVCQRISRVETGLGVCYPGTIEGWAWSERK